MTRQVRNELYERMIYVGTEEELSRFESFLNSIGCKWQSGDSLRERSYFCPHMYFHVDWDSWRDTYQLTRTSPMGVTMADTYLTLDEYLGRVGYSSYTVPCTHYKRAALDALEIED